MPQQIQEGFMVFAADGAGGIGSVREVRPEQSEVVVYIENGGDFVVPFGDIKDVHSGKVVLELERLDPALRTAIDHAHDAEDPNYDESGSGLDESSAGMDDLAL